MVNPVGISDITSFHDNNDITIRSHRIRNDVDIDFDGRRAPPAGIIYVKIVSIFNTTRRKYMACIICVTCVRRVY